MAKHIFKGTTPPFFAPKEVGHHYVDTTLRQTYISVGTSSPSDWLMVNSSTSAHLKAGRLLNSDFSGSPKKATVTFSINIPTPYGVNITGVDTRAWSIESMTISGFVVNSNANSPLFGDVFWEVQQIGEY